MRPVLVLPLLLAAAPALAEPTVVSFLSEGQEVVGTLEVPPGNPAPVVLLLHGFTGSRDELPIPSADNEGVFARTARLLSDAGFASLRIDFRGSGESTADMTFAETTFDSQIADATAAIAYLRTVPEVRSDDLYLIGWSQGGLVATAVAGRSEAFDAVALWAAVAAPPETYAGILGDEMMQAGMAAGPEETVSTTLPWGATIELNGAFFDGVERFDPVAEIAAYRGPLFVAQGTNDTTVPPAGADLLIEAHDGPEDLWIRPMDHVFNAFETAATLDEMVGATVAFFEAPPQG